MNLIACADKNWGIGLNGKLLFRIPEDLKRFKAMTTDKIVVMGRKTLESLPGSKPLPNRTNIVFSRSKDFKARDAMVINSIDDFLKAYEVQNNENIFVIGGEEIYRKLTPFCKYAYITRVDKAVFSDAHIDDFDKLKNFRLAERSPEFEYKDLKYAFYTYENTDLN